MPISDWDCPARLITPQGTIYFNEEAQAEGRYLQIKEGCDAGANTRATRNPVPQAGGSILNRGFDDGYLLRLSLVYYARDFHDPACSTSDPTLADVDDFLMLHLRAILDGGGRYIFSPPGVNERLLDELRLVERPVITVESGQTSVAFTLASPFPYTIDFAQILTQLSAGSPSAVLDNTGTAPFFPVYKVYGPFDTFEIDTDQLDDEGNPFRIVYSDTLPGAVPVGGGDYVEIDTFRNTIYLNGNGASRKAGISIIESDFFTLNPGNNTITVSGGGSNAAPDVDILWNPAWF